MLGLCGFFFHKKSKGLWKEGQDSGARWRGVRNEAPLTRSEQLTRIPIGGVH